MRDLAVLDVAPGGGELEGSGGAEHHWKRTGGFGHLEPANVVDGGGCPADRGLDGVLDADGGRADQLDQLVDVVGHLWASFVTRPHNGLIGATLPRLQREHR